MKLLLAWILLTSAFELPVGPPLPLKPSLPVTMNTENQQRIEKKKENSAADFVKAFDEASFPWLEWLAALLAGTLLVLAFRPKKPVPPTQEEIVLDAKQKAMQALEKLQKSGLGKNVDKFYVDLTDTVRTFFEKKYGLKATTQTTTEFLQDLQNFSLEDRKEVKEFLSHADRVKFAQYQPNQGEWESALKSAIHLIQDNHRAF